MFHDKCEVGIMVPMSRELVSGSEAKTKVVKNIARDRKFGPGHRTRNMGHGTGGHLGLAQLVTLSGPEDGKKVLSRNDFRWRRSHSEMKR
jgi:hypothetical protein